MALSQRAFGEIGGVKANAQVKYEKGERNPDSAYLAAVAAAGVDVLYVLSGQRTPQSQEALSVREQKVLFTFRELSPEDQSSVQRLQLRLSNRRM